MIREHPQLRLPSPDTKLWRHLDLAKFLSLLEDRTLWFTRLDKLGDPYEGLPTRPIVDETWSFPNDLGDQERAHRLLIARHNTQVYSTSPRLLYVSCWHAGPVESAAMWRLYAPPDAGIAICTTLDRLEDGLTDPASPILGGVHGGLVRYVDFDSFRPDSFNILDWATLKRQSFEHEREFRLIAFPGEELLSLAIPIDLATVVSEVWVSPEAPHWYTSIIEMVCRRYGLKAPVRQSALLKHPAYMQVPEEGGT